MTRAFLLVLLTAVLLCSCEQEDDNAPKRSPSITYRTDSGYTSADDTVGMGDTVLIGVTMQQGSDEIAAFMVRVAFDGQSAYEQRDSIVVGSQSFSFEKQIVTRNQPGSEKWMFGVEETDGDGYFRPIKLTVQ